MCGGGNAEEGWDTGLRSVEYFANLKMFWKQVTSMLGPQYCFSAVVLSCKVLVWGGTKLVFCVLAKVVGLISPCELCGCILECFALHFS